MFNNQHVLQDYLAMRPTDVELLSDVFKIGTSAPVAIPEFDSYDSFKLCINKCSRIWVQSFFYLANLNFKK